MLAKCVQFSPNGQSQIMFYSTVPLPRRGGNCQIPARRPGLSLRDVRHGGRQLHAALGPGNTEL